MLAFLTLLHLVFSKVLVFTTGSLERSLMDQESLLAEPRVPQLLSGLPAFLLVLLNTTASSSCSSRILANFLLIN